MNAWVWRGLVVILSLGLVGTSQPLKAAPLDVCQAMASADWATATNWSCGHAPTSIDAAMLPAGVTLAVNTDSEVGDLTLAYETVDLRTGGGVAMTLYAAEPGSASEHALQLLASWAATSIPMPDRADA